MLASLRSDLLFLNKLIKPNASKSSWGLFGSDVGREEKFDFSRLKVPSLAQNSLENFILCCKIKSHLPWNINFQNQTTNISNHPRKIFPFSQPAKSNCSIQETHKIIFDDLRFQLLSAASATARVKIFTVIATSNSLFKTALKTRFYASYLREKVAHK